jgi:hypothetical protein
VYHRKEEEGRKPRETNPDLACKDRRLGNEHALSLDRRVVMKFFVVLGSEINYAAYLSQPALKSGFNHTHGRLSS